VLTVVLAIAVAFLNSDAAKRKILWCYNQISVYLESASNAVSPATHHFGVHIPKGYTVHGIDVSRYQQKINWAEVAKEREGEPKIAFAFIKASEGKTLSDSYFSYNMREARAQGMLVGAYHYYKPNINSTKQAQNFINLVDLLPGDLPPVLDIEEESPYGNENMLKGIRNWLEIVEQHYGMTPIIYTSNSFHRDCLSSGGFERYPFWIAHYYKKEIKTESRWLFWQHSDKARISGIESCTDINVFNGSVDELKGLCKQ
jgi:lysozyme